jgi:hypothetical protein
MAQPLDPITPRTTSPWKLAKDDAPIEGTPEALLLDAVIRLNDFPQGRIATHVRLSHLQAHHKKPHYLQMAFDMFEAHVKTYDGRIFQLGGGDLFFLARHMKMEALIQAVDRLRLLFSEDPLAHYTADGSGEAFAVYYDLEKNYSKLREDTLALHKVVDRERRAQKAANLPPAKKQRRPFEPSDLSSLIRIIERADLASIVHYQTACVLGVGGIPQPLFRESFVSLDDLQQRCTPDIDLLSDRWLFHYLTRTLDKRMLALLGKDGMLADLPFSLNLNISTLLSPEFRKFDARVPDHLRGKSMVEIHKVDVFSDIGAYIFARDFLHDRGYKLCLDGLTHHTLPFFDKHELGLDFFKIYWAPEGLNAAHPSFYPEIAKMIADYGAKRVILCRAENEEALRVGKEIGLTQFQGHYIDRLLQAVRTGQPALPPPQKT